MKKTIFKFNIDNIISIITNSSSELFILEAETKEIVKEMISSRYPDYRSEYEEVKNISELSVDELDTYFSYATYPSVWPASKSSYRILPGFTFDELYEPKKDYKTGLPEKPAWNGEIQYELKKNEGYNFVTKENREELISKLSPNKNMWFLFSIDENPNYDMQEELEYIAERYHLG